jgi:hypothetical protein
VRAALSLFEGKIHRVRADRLASRAPAGAQRPRAPRKGWRAAALCNRPAPWSFCTASGDGWPSRDRRRSERDQSERHRGIGL